MYRACVFATAKCLHLALTSHRDAHLALLPAAGLLAVEGHLWTGSVPVVSRIHIWLFDLCCHVTISTTDLIMISPSKTRFSGFASMWRIALRGFSSNLDQYFNMIVTMLNTG